MRKLAKWCFTHRRIVALAWVGALVSLTAIHSAAGSAYSDNFNLSGTQSFDAVHLLERAAPKASGDTDQIVIAVEQRQGDRPGRALAGGVDARQRREAAPCLGRVIALRTDRRVADLVLGPGRVRECSVRRPGQQDQGGRRPAVREHCPRGRGQRGQGRGRGPGRPGGEQNGTRRIAVRLPRRRGRPVPGVRLAARDGAAAAHRRAGARHRRRRDRPALAPDPDGLVQQRAVAPDRARSRGRLRPVHPHPLPPGPAPRSERRGGRDRVGRHIRSRRAVRRNHRLHRPARSIRAGRELPVRRRDRGVHRSRVDGDRRAHAAARAAGVLRDPRASPARATPAQGRGAARPPTSRRAGRGGPGSSKSARRCSPPSPPA